MYKAEDVISYKYITLVQTYIQMSSYTLCKRETSEIMW